MARKHKRRKSNSLKQIYCKPLASGQPGGSQSREIHFNNITLGFENGGVERQCSFPKSYQKPISEENLGSPQKKKNQIYCLKTF